MHNIDFYITKYVAKPLTSMKPIMAQFHKALDRLESEITTSLPGNVPVEMTFQQKAKKTLLKIANAANACHWHSATELAVILMTGGDMLQTHAVQTVFCSQLIYMLHKAKELVVQGGEDGKEDVCDEANVGLVTVPVPVSAVRTNKNADSDAETDPRHSDSGSDSDSNQSLIQEPGPDQKAKKTMTMPIEVHT